ncbi:pleckstrin homology domain-containing family J member 1 isoform X2 [Pelodiscus sinensis]|uniref:pleckstrin homology domain-containing family J member 1 isoform X2 n=1 Tax=Pelodiscus sinensis TaxID=13735 RepID=UPI003F6CD99E
MRYNERELLALARQPAEKAAEILMRVPKKGSVLKKRLVKLVVNFLFYFRIDEGEPIGALLLEHCRVTKEEENVFSISFIEEPDRKYSFECDTEEQCQEWIEALRRASGDGAGPILGSAAPVQPGPSAPCLPATSSCGEV